MPTPLPNIDATIAYILAKWVQNNNQAITGTIGQNVVWNLAEFIKQNPENWEKATLVPSNGNYTAQPGECIVIFTNNSSGGLDFVDNIWYKWYFVNQTNNDRTLINGKFFFDVNGATVEKISARSVVTIAKGEDDNWYQIDNMPAGQIKDISGVAGDGGADDPIVGSTLYQNNKLKGLGGVNGRLTIVVNNQIQNNFGQGSSITFDPATGIINVAPNKWVDQDSLYIDLNQ